MKRDGLLQDIPLPNDTASHLQNTATLIFTPVMNQFSREDTAFSKDYAKPKGEVCMFHRSWGQCQR